MTEELEIIYYLVYQHIADDDLSVDSKFISADADAIRHLADAGLVENVHDGGGRVISGRLKA
jgi:hypothetical protein